MGSIAKKTGQHLKESIAVKHQVETRYDPYVKVDEGWDDSTDQLVTEIFMLAGEASKILSEMYFRIAIL